MMRTSPSFSDHPRLSWSSDEFALGCYLALAGFVALTVTVAMYLYATTL